MAWHGMAPRWRGPPRERRAELGAARIELDPPVPAVVSDRITRSVEESRQGRSCEAPNGEWKMTLQLAILD